MSIPMTKDISPDSRHFETSTYALFTLFSWSIHACLSSSVILGRTESISVWETGGAAGEVRDCRTLSMMSQADVKESWKRMIRDPFKSISRQRFFPSPSSLPITTFSLVRFHIVVAITICFFESLRHKVSNSNAFPYGEPTQRLSEIRYI
jgi:hypothetical protein